jgi:hypothetical protein
MCLVFTISSFSADFPAGGGLPLFVVVRGKSIGNGLGKITLAPSSAGTTSPPIDLSVRACSIFPQLSEYQCLIDCLLAMGDGTVQLTICFRTLSDGEIVVTSISCTVVPHPTVAIHALLSQLVTTTAQIQETNERIQREIVDVVIPALKK